MQFMSCILARHFLDWPVLTSFVWIPIHCLQSKLIPCSILIHSVQDPFFVFNFVLSLHSLLQVRKPNVFQNLEYWEARKLVVFIHCILGERCHPVIQPESSSVEWDHIHTRKAFRQKQPHICLRKGFVNGHIWYKLKRKTLSLGKIFPLQPFWILELQIRNYRVYIDLVFNLLFLTLVVFVIFLKPTYYCPLILL